jgi:hypothetical protein
MFGFTAADHYEMGDIMEIGLAVACGLLPTDDAPQQSVVPAPAADQQLSQPMPSELFGPDSEFTAMGLAALTIPGFVDEFVETCRKAAREERVPDGSAPRLAVAV